MLIIESKKFNVMKWVKFAIWYFLRDEKVLCDIYSLQISLISCFATPYGLLLLLLYLDSGVRFQLLPWATQPWRSRLPYSALIMCHLHVGTCQKYVNWQGMFLDLYMNKESCFRPAKGVISNFLGILRTPKNDLTVSFNIIFRRR